MSSVSSVVKNTAFAGTVPNPWIPAHHAFGVMSGMTVVFSLWTLDLELWTPNIRKPRLTPRFFMFGSGDRI